MKKLLAISAATLLVASSAAWAEQGSCYGAKQSIKSVSTAPTQTLKPANPVTTVKTASTSATKTVR